MYPSHIFLGYLLLVNKLAKQTTLPRRGGQNQLMLHFTCYEVYHRSTARGSFFSCSSQLGVRYISQGHGNDAVVKAGGGVCGAIV